MMINPDEIRKFAAQAQEWWQEDGTMKSLHAINFPRCLFIDGHISVAGKSLIDIGCGGGLFAEAMAERGAQVTGIDPSEELIHVARQHAGEKNLHIDYRRETATEMLAARKNHGLYDIVSCLEVLEHVPEPRELIRECARLLKTGGWGFFSTINRTPLAYLLAVLGGEYILRWLPRGTHSYRQFIKPAELHEWLEENGLISKFISGIRYDPLMRKFCLGSSVAVNYLILAHKEV